MGEEFIKGTLSVTGVQRIEQQKQTMPILSVYLFSFWCIQVCDDADDSAPLCEHTCLSTFVSVRTH